MNDTTEIEMETNTDFEVRSLDSICINESTLHHPWWFNIKYLFAGILFGIILVKSEVISWFRIQEMFHLASFHMYGVIGSAVVVGIISVFLIKKFIMLQLREFSLKRMQVHKRSKHICI